nr:protease complex subunit PrcB family protein [Evansella tamaricis]
MQDADVSDYLTRLRQNTNIRGWNAIEYQGGTVLVVSAGQRNTGGYYLEVSGVQEESDGVRVDIIEHRPGPGDMVTMAITNPYIIIEFPDMPPDANWKVYDVKRGEFFPYWTNSSGVEK